jgi:hypothetical protein
MFPRRCLNRVRFFALVLPVLALTVASAQANSLITFETRPNGNTPTDNASLLAPYAIDGGSVRFFFDVAQSNVYNNTYDDGIDERPVFEERGDADGDPSGFRSTKNVGSDRPSAPGLGSWFIRQPGDFGTTPFPGNFIVDYDTTQTINALSGEIWDIDAGPGGATEQWLVEVLDRDNNVVTSQLSPLGIDQTDPDSLDSLPWTFGFTNLTARSSLVDKVRISFVGSKTAGIGLAFNNFSAFTSLAPTPVPEPGTLLLSGIGLAGVALARRARRAAQSTKE